MILNLPNLLTLSRIGVIPPIVALFYWEDPLSGWVACGLFAVAGITDFLDGYVARIWSQHSRLGRMLDPIADKLLVSAVILMLIANGSAPVLAALVILCRELLVSGLREFLAELSVSVPVSRLAKWKTTVQMIAIGFLLVGDAGPVFFHPALTTTAIGYVLMWLAAGFTLITGFDYLRVGLKHVTLEEAPAIGHEGKSRPAGTAGPTEPSG